MEHLASPAPAFDAVFDQSPVPLLLLTPDLVIVRANRARLAVTATSQAETVGRPLFDVFPANPQDPASSGLTELRASLELVRDTGRPHTMPIRRYDIKLPDGSHQERFWSLHTVPILDRDGRVTLILHRSDDVTDYVRDREAARSEAARGAAWRERMEQVEADLYARTRQLEASNAELRAAGERAALLARITEDLTGTMDAEEAVARLAQLVVPALGDWCVVTLVEDARAGAGRGLRDVGVWHVDPQLRPLVQAYADARLKDIKRTSFLSRALTTGRRTVITGDVTAQIRTVLNPGVALDRITELAPESIVVLPLPGRGSTAGLLTVCSGAARGPITVEELAAATDVAGRAGLALDNARLYQQQRRLAEGLQRSLLTAPAEPDHCEVAVRYLPAAAAARVGGDWYDAFLQRDGDTVLAIGDVLGHDTDAAASMGQIRSLLRGIAVHSGAGPADVLRGVDQAMSVLQMQTTATAIVARVEQTPQERRRGVTRVCWSNAGHPPPIIVTPAGRAQPLRTLDPDLLLGVDPDGVRAQTEVTLDRGSTLLLYTDGLVERRGRSLEDAIAALCRTLEEPALRRCTLEELCDEVLRRCLPSASEDDVALLAVRLHRQDQPRPVEAGPVRIPPGVPDEVPPS